MYQLKGLILLTHVYTFIEWLVWVGRDLKDHLVPTPSHRQGHLPPDQAAACTIQSDLEHCQGQGIHSFSGQPVPVSCHHQIKEFLPYI